VCLAFSAFQLIGIIDRWIDKAKDFSPEMDGHLIFEKLKEWIELYRKIEVKPGTDIIIFKNIFAEKFGVKLAFLLKLLLVFSKFLITILILEKHHFWQKIGKNRRKF
jgi:hypothetical protein